MDFKKKIEEVTSRTMSNRGLKLLEGIVKRLPDIWQKPVSSTGKYHKKLNGEVPTISEHVYHMVYAAEKLLSVFDIKKQTIDADKIILPIVLHDVMKYGNLGTRKHTDIRHDKDAADMVSQNKQTFLKLFSEEQFDVMEEMIRFHSGRWSTDISKNEEFSFKNYKPETLFIHILDMMSTADLIQTDMRE